MLSVFSTYVEVILRNYVGKTKNSGILHVCGGDPSAAAIASAFGKYSPRMWRWSSRANALIYLFKVFSTYVEVILDAYEFVWDTISILHVCGGDPIPTTNAANKVLYSPRMWRWSQFFQLARMHDKVFSTYVEVIPKKKSFKENYISILHVCGGDPKSHG